MKLAPLRQSIPQPTEVQSALREGLIVADKYELVSKLGAGAMGTVWKATHTMLGHGVAIKFLHASVEEFPQGRARFEREAKIAARLGEASRHISRVTDFGVLDNGTPYVVMELLHGEELSERLRRDEVLPLPLVAEITAQLCRALAVAHEAGVVHRDLKPANVFLCTSDDGQPLVKLLDFGVAKTAFGPEAAESTRAGLVFGTLAYMSPEQLAGEAVDGRADLWGVAVMVYRMAVGRPPYGTGSLRELGLRIMTTEPPAPSRVRSDLPASFDLWVRKGLAKQRTRRFGDAAELAEALLEVSRHGAGARAARGSWRAVLLEPLRHAWSRWGQTSPAKRVASALVVLSGLLGATLQASTPPAADAPGGAGSPSLSWSGDLSGGFSSVVAPFAGLAQAEVAPQAGPRARGPRGEAPRARAKPERRTVRRAQRPAVAASESKAGDAHANVAQRAAQLWNKVDEL